MLQIQWLRYLEVEFSLFFFLHEPHWAFFPLVHAHHSCMPVIGWFGGDLHENHHPIDIWLVVRVSTCPNHVNVVSTTVCGFALVCLWWRKANACFHALQNSWWVVGQDSEGSDGVGILLTSCVQQGLLPSPETG
jgi:hypothetical protein